MLGGYINSLRRWFYETRVTRIYFHLEAVQADIPYNKIRPRYYQTEKLLGIIYGGY